MTTDELERVLEAALHRPDDQPVDLGQGRAELIRRLDRQGHTRRTAILAAAAAVLAVVAATSSVVVLHDRDRPAPPTGVTLSPSGLPVGLLEGKVTRSAGHIAVSNIRLRVLPDGTGSVFLGGGTMGSSDGSGGYLVEYVRLGPGRVAVSYDGPICGSDRALTFLFTVHGRTVTVLDAQSPGCLVSEGITTDLPGTRLHLSPLPDLG